MRPWRTLVWWIVAYAVAMALLEAAVVVYLRALYYPAGFKFPLVPIDHDLGAVEVAREAATMLMLLAPAAMVRRSALERFAWFCFAFGVWDIFYYVWLRVFIGWPASLVEWDILFLIPVPWIGPVIAPCLISVGLIAFAIMILHASERTPGFRVRWPEWWWMIGGSSVMILSFMTDYLGYLSGREALSSAWSIGPGDEATFAMATGYVPRTFPWWLFSIGLAGALVGLLLIARRASRPRQDGKVAPTM